MYLVFVAYYDSMIFSKILCSEDGGFLPIIEIALLFHLQLYKPGWLDLEPKWARLARMGHMWDFFRSELSTFWLGEPTVLDTLRNIHTRKINPAFYLLVKIDYIGSD